MDVVPILLIIYAMIDTSQDYSFACGSGAPERKLKWKWIYNGQTQARPRMRHRYDFIGRPEKRRFERLANELIQEAKNIMRQVSLVQEKHDGFVGWNVGLIIGKIRESYRIMLEIYRESSDFRFERTIHRAPGHDRTFYFTTWMHWMEWTRKHELTIEELVKVIESIPHAEWYENNTAVNPNIYTGVRLQQQMRRNAANKLAEKMAIEQEKLKSDLRQRYLMRKLGQPINSTTPKKRFINQWPVTDTWDEHFDEMY